MVQFIWDGDAIDLEGGEWFNLLVIVTPSSWKMVQFIWDGDAIYWERGEWFNLFGVVTPSSGRGENGSIYLGVHPICGKKRKTHAEVFQKYKLHLQSTYLPAILSFSLSLSLSVCLSVSLSLSPTLILSLL